jgi:hypothetical protein
VAEVNVTAWAAVAEGSFSMAAARSGRSAPRASAYRSAAISHAADRRANQAGDEGGAADGTDAHPRPRHIPVRTAGPQRTCEPSLQSGDPHETP